MSLYSQNPVPTKPSHLLFFSRVFSADAFSDDEAMDEDDDDEATGLAGARRRKAKLARREAKKQGAKKDAQKVRDIAQGTGVSGADQDELGLFHPEDKAITKVSDYALRTRKFALTDSIILIVTLFSMHHTPTPSASLHQRMQQIALKRRSSDVLLQCRTTSSPMS